jgi:predicted acetyltransferase
MLRYAFESDKNKYEKPKDPPEPWNWYPTTFYITEDKGKIAAAVGVIEFDQRVRGSAIKMAGITGVTCRPEYRRKGCMKDLFEYTFNDLKTKKNFLVSALYPFEFKFYEKLGYGQADSMHFYTIKTSNIIHRPTPNRMIEEVYDPDYQRCQPLYEKLYSELNGLVERPPSVWKFLDSWNWKKGGFQFICHNLKGKDLGYIILQFEKKNDSIPVNHINVREMVYFDSDTKQALLNFLANHDSQREEITFPAFDRNMLPYLKSPRIRHNKEIANSMFRIINVEQLFPELNYYDDINADITFEITDTLCKWNSKVITLRVKEGKGIIIKDPSTLIIQLGIKELSQIVIGFHDPFEFAEAGLVKGDSKSLALLTQIFPKQITALRDYF